MNIPIQPAPGPDPGKSANGYVLPDAPEERLARLVHGDAAQRQRVQGGEVRRIALGGQFRERSGKVLEILGLGDEIGLAVDFQDRACFRVRRDMNRHHALGSRARRGPGRLVAESDAQELLGFG